MSELPVIPKHLTFAHVLVLCKEELNFSEAVFGRDGLFRWGYDEPAIEDVEAWMPLPTRLDTTPGSTLKVMRGPGGGLYLSGVEDLREGDVFRREVRRDKP